MDNATDTAFISGKMGICGSALGRIEKRNCTVVSYGSIMEKMFKKKLVGLKSVCRENRGTWNNRGHFL